MIAVLQLLDGTQIPLSMSDLEYWDWYLLPFGAVILGDYRRFHGHDCGKEGV